MMIEPAVPVPIIERAVARTMEYVPEELIGMMDSNSSAVVSIGSGVVPSSPAA